MFSTDRSWVERYRVALAAMNPAVHKESDLHYPTERLIRAVGGEVTVLSEAEAPVGRPDLKVCVESGERVVGWVELKHMDKPADPRRFSGTHDRDQWQRFQVLPNLVYSNGYEASLWRDGVLTAGVVGVEQNPGGWASLWEEFLSYTPTVDPDPGRLAVTLGRRVRLLRDAVRAAMDGGSDHLRQTFDLWRKHLLPDLTEERFVDEYAQMPMAGLLLARGLLPDVSAEAFGPAVAQQALEDRGYGALAELLHHVNVSADAGAAVCLSALSDAAAALDPSKPSDDGWWAGFYEPFLDIYDRQLRIDMGVFYTPKEIVDYQIRTTDWVLRNCLNMGKGFVTEGVVTLDPACGTGTYLTRLIQQVADHSGASAGPGAVGENVRQIAKSIYGFEIMAGPYTVARMRLVAKCAAYDAEMDPSRVLLTDTLSSTGKNQMFDMFAQNLANEQAKANKVKDPDTRVTVVIGNPPYDRDQSQAGVTLPEPLRRSGRFGGMIRHSKTGGLGLIKEFRDKTPAVMRRQFHMVYELSTYFWRWAVWKVCEQAHPDGTVGGPGVVSYISPSAWLHSDPWAGMRHHLRARFDRIWVVDLGGDQRSARTDGENVFPIQTPVCITVAVRSRNHSETSAATVLYRKINGRTRTEKLAELGNIALDGEGWELAPASPGTATFLFVGQATAYEAQPAVDEVLPWQSPGVQYNRSWPIAVTKSVLAKRWQRLMAASVTGNPEIEGSREQLFKETRDRKLSKQVKRLDGGPADPLLKDLTVDAPIPPVVRYGHRPFCLRWAIADNRIGDMMRPNLWQAHSQQQAYLVTSHRTEAAGDGPTAVVYTHIPDKHSHHGRGGMIFPLWRDSQSNGANADSATVKHLTARYGQEVTGEQVWHYTAGLLGTKAYPQFWADPMGRTLRPHIPFPRTHNDFAALVTVGIRLVDIARGTNLADSGVRCVTPVNPAELPTLSRRCYNPDRGTLILGGGQFIGITADIWNHEVSGYRTLQRWIRIRSARPGGRPISPLDHITPETWLFTQDLIDVCNGIVSLNQASDTAHPVLERLASTLGTQQPPP